MYIIGKKEAKAVERVIRSGQLFRYSDDGSPTETGRFEKEWAKKIGTKYCFALSSGSAALTCGLAGLGIGPGDEVIVPAYTFIASALAPLTVGAVPVIADVDESLTIAPADVERKITRRTKAIMPVYMCGLPCEMTSLMRIARVHKLAVVEDAAQAGGGSYRGRRFGSIGDVGGFSFNHFKIISSGEGGAVVTNNRALFEKALIYHDGGGSIFFRPDAKNMKTPFFGGHNYRISEILSAILREQLKRLDGILRSLRAEKRLMTRELLSCSAFRLNPVRDEKGDCASTLGLLFESEKEMRAFERKLGDAGIGCWSPIDSGRHVYTNWEPIMDKRGAHHPGQDAYKLAKVPVRYSRDMCKRTLDILSRTLYIMTSPTRSRSELGKLIKTIKQL